MLLYSLYLLTLHELQSNCQLQWSLPKEVDCFNIYTWMWHYESQLFNIVPPNALMNWSISLNVRWIDQLRILIQQVFTCLVIPCLQIHGQYNCIALLEFTQLNWQWSWVLHCQSTEHSNSNNDPMCLSTITHYLLLHLSIAFILPQSHSDVWLSILSILLIVSLGSFSTNGVLNVFFVIMSLIHLLNRKF